MDNFLKKSFCCLNSRKTKSLEYILLALNLLCLLFYILFFSTISWIFISILFKLLFYLNLFFLLISIIINIYFILIRKKRLINSQMNSTAFILILLIILICILAIIINYSLSIKILLEFKSLGEKKIIYYTSKKNNIISILSILIVNIIWITILFLWVADSIRIKYKTDDTFYNFLKIKRHKKNFYLFKEENAKESNSQLQKLENSNKNKIMKTIQNLKKELVFPLKFSANKELIEDQNSQSINVIIENNVKNLNISNNSNEHSHSKNSSVLSDSFQKPENMIIIGTDENGYPIYGHQNSFDKSQKGNDDSDSFSNNEKKFNQSNYIKFNDTTLNVDDTMNDIENNLEKNSILEKDIDEIKPKIIEKKNENDNENENENNDYKEHFMPLQSGENDKEIENQVNELQTNKIN